MFAKVAIIYFTLGADIDANTLWMYNNCLSYERRVFVTNVNYKIYMKHKGGGIKVVGSIQITSIIIRKYLHLEMDLIVYTQ